MRESRGRIERRALVAALGLVACVALPARARAGVTWGPPSAGRQADAGELERARSRLAKYKRYLDRSPFHERSFDGLVEAAVSVNELESLVEDYEARLEKDPQDRSARVVLARLCARTDQDERAIELLAAVEGEQGEQDGVGLALLLGVLHLGRNEPARALEQLERAAELARDAAELEEVHRRRGEAYLVLGDRERAAQAFHALAELDPESLDLRLDAADLLARGGLHAEALGELAEAERLAGADNARRCRVLSEMGRLHERLLDVVTALEVYARAIDLMGRGNWLKRDLQERVLAIHERSGTMEALVDASRAKAGAERQDLDAREFQARALERAGRREEARDVLAAAVVDFPEDLGLSRRRIEVLEALEDVDGVVAEYQRILGARPEELELYVELGRIFAAEGRLAQARLQWNRTLEKRLQDAGLCVRLAGLYSLYEMSEDAVAMYEKAIELEPGEMRHYADLCAFLAVRDRRDEVLGVLERASEHAPGDASRLEELATLWSEHGDASRARVALEGALSLRPDDARLERRLADALVEEGQLERAADILHHVIESAREPVLRKSSVDRVVRLFRQSGRLAELVELEERALREGSESAAPRLVLGKLWIQERQPDRAVEVLEGLLARDAGNEDARKQLARLYEERGDHHAGLAQYEALIEARPQSRRQYLKEIARIHLALYDQERAFACYEEILRAAPDNPAAFKEVADAYEELGLHDRAAECLEQAVRLKPEDGRYRLELAAALKRLGEWDRARGEILAAVRDGEDEVRSDARKEYYLLLSETGRVTEEIDALQERSERNPYDLEAPLALTDVYVRELEYELALELLDRLLAYQPKEGRLLEERARLLALLERHDQALADYESLWKLPDADRQRLALKIAEQSILAGDLERAERVLSTVADLQQVAALYAQHDLFDESIAALRRGIARAPADARLLSRLARQQERIGEREAAAETLERVLALSGDSWRTLKRLGELQHELGRKEQAIECGRRLFALVRVEEEPDEDDEEDPGASSAYSGLRYYGPYGYYGGNAPGTQQYAERIGEIQGYFLSQGYAAEFVEIGADEVRLQPTNQALLTSVLNGFTELEDRAADARRLVREVRAATRDGERRPPGSTPAQWMEYLDTLEMARYREHATLAEERAAELEALLAAAEGRERDCVELVQLLDLLHRESEAIVALRAGLEALPDSPRLLAALAQKLSAEEEHAEAAELYRSAIAALESAGDDGEAEARHELSFKQRKQGLLRGFPVHLQSRVDDAQLRRLFDLTYARGLYGSWTLGARLSADGLRLSLARCLLRLDRTDEAREVLAALEPEREDDLLRWARLAATYFAEELFDDAERIYRHLAALEERLAADPLLGFQRSWARHLDLPMQNLARIHEKRGEVLAAYDLLRDYGAGAACELLLTTNEAFAETEAELRRRVAAEEQARREDEELFDARRYRNAGIKLAEVLQFQKRWDEALATYERLAAVLEDDFVLLRSIAELHLRAGRKDEAIATHFRVLERKRELNRRPYRPAEPEGRRLTPTSSLATPREDYTFTRLRQSYRGRGARFNLRDDYVTILKLYLDDRRTREAAEVLREIARDDASAMRWLSYSLRQLVDQYQLGADAIPILRLVHSHAPDDLNSALEYGKTLQQTGQLEEARRVYERVLEKGRGESYYRDQARARIEEIVAELGEERRETLAELEAAVAAEPKNVKVRTRLVQRYLDEERCEEALEHARSAEALAPHLEEVALLVSDCLQLTGRVDEYEARLRARLPKVKEEEERFVLLVRLADWMAERGELQAVEELFRRHADLLTKGNGSFAPSSWFLMEGELAKAEELLREEIERLGKANWNVQEARARLTGVLLLRGDPLGALDELWEQSEDLASLQAKNQLLGAMAGVLRRVGDPGPLREPVWRAAEEHPGTRGALLRIAWALAAGELDEAEALIEAWVQGDDEARFLYPTLVSLARERGDLRAALTYLERLERDHELSASQRVSTSIGQLHERNALRAERGSLLFELGEVEAARAVWDEMFEPDDDAGRQMLAKLYALHGLHAEAAELLRAQLAERGERRSQDLIELAGYERELGDLEETVRLLERALLLTTPADGSRATVRVQHARAYREAGRLEELFVRLSDAVAADPHDDELRGELARVALELGRDDVARECYAHLVEKGDAGQAALPVLLRLFAEDGQRAEALELVARSLEESGLQEWERDRRARQLARALLEAGDDERAAEVLEKTHGRREGGEFQGALATLYEGLDRFDAALPLLDELARRKPEDLGLQARRARTLRELGRLDEAWEAVCGSLGEAQTDYERRTARRELVAVARALERERRLDGVLAANPTDPRTRLARVHLASVDGDHETAARLLAELRAEEPGNRAVLDALWPTLRVLGRHAEARAVVAELIEAYEREQGIVREGWRAGQRLSGLTGALRELYLEQGLFEDALALWENPPGARFREIQAWTYAYYNSPFQLRASFADWLFAREMYARFLEVEASRRLFEEWDPERGGARQLEARYRAGDGATALEDAWTIAVRAGEGLVDEFTGGNVIQRLGNTQVGAIGQLLVRLHAEEGRSEELVERLQAEHENRPRAHLRELLVHALQEAERWAEVAELRRREVEESPEDLPARATLARALKESGQLAEALEHYEIVHARRRAGPPPGNQQTYVTSGGSNPLGKIRFQWSAGAMGFSGTTYFSSGSGVDVRGPSSLATVRPQVAALHAALGDLEAARRLERVAADVAFVEGRSEAGALLAAARAYAELDLVGEAERAYRAAVELGDPYASTAWPALVALFGRVGDEAKHREYVELELARRAEGLERSPGDGVLHASRALFRLREADDPEGARSDAERALELAPLSATALAAAGWVRLEAQDVHGALEHFRAARERLEVQGRSRFADLEYGLGLALAAADGPEAAAPILRRALATWPEAHGAERAAAVLE